MLFEVRALDPQRRGVSLSLGASDAAAAAAQAQGQGLAVLSARQRARVPALSQVFEQKFPLLQFTQELVALLRAGLSIPATLEVMGEKENRPEGRAASAQMRNALYEGRSFPQALVQGGSRHFPDLYVATVRASE